MRDSDSIPHFREATHDFSSRRTYDSMFRLSMLCLAAVTVCTFPSSLLAQIEVDPDLPVYQRVSGVSGTIKSIGSDTMNNMMTLWGEGFTEIYPNVQIEIEGKGSSTAPPALIQGTASFGPMSRPMKPERNR